MKVIEKIEEMKGFSRDLRTGGKTIAFVPTMGYLHSGHVSLIRKARPLADAVVLSVFVNPLQFAPSEDYMAYPRDMKKDTAISEKEGVDVLFSPVAEEMYPKGCSTYVSVEGLSQKLCGEKRPGHFKGVATVVLKLFNIVMPHVALFGLKDFQQQLVIKKMVKDLDMDIKIVTIDTVRESDGLALSSRNSYLTEKERSAASLIPGSLEAAKEAFSSGERESRNIIETVKKIMEKEPLVVIDYIKICNPLTLEEVNVIEDKALLLIAIRIGKARLIDNLMLG